LHVVCSTLVCTGKWRIPGIPPDHKQFVWSGKNQ